MAAVIFNGSFVKTLKDNIKVGVGENIFLMSGDSDDPTSVAKDAPEGSIYWRLGTSEIYQKLDNGSSTSWSRMDGDIKGPGTSTDEAVARWDGATGLLLQDSPVLINDTGTISGVQNITLSGTVDGRDVSVDGAALDSHLDGGASKHDANEIDYERVDGSKVDIQAASDELEAAVTDLDDTKLSVAGNNTMTADLDMGTNAITNVGNVDGRDVSADGSTLDGHLDGGASKHDATEIDYERLDGSKKNIQASSDDTESAITDLDDAIGALTASPTNYTPASPTIVSSHLIGIDTELGNITNLINSFEWQDSALDYITDNTAVPPTEVSGNRYVLSDDGGAPNAAWDGASAGDIVEFNGTTWDATTPTIGMMISIDDETTSLRQWGGSSWSQKFFESTTASGFLSMSTFDVQLTNLSSQNLILGSAGNVATSVDLSTLGEINGTTAGGLVIKTNTVVNAQVNSAAAIEFSKMENLTANRALASDASGDVSATAVTDTELGFVSGVTSALQTQLDAKLDDFSSTTDNVLMRSNGTAGDAVQDSSVVLSDTDAMTGLASLTFTTGVLASSILDEDNLVSDSDTALATQQSIKAYVDSSVAAGVFDVNSISTNTNAVANKTYLVDVSGGVVTVTLPAPAANTFVKIKDSTSSANTNNITVARNGSEEIDTVAGNYTIDSNLQASVFVSDGTDWFVF